MRGHFSSNRSCILTGAVALTSDNKSHPNNVPELPQKADFPGIQLSGVSVCGLADFTFFY